MFGAVQGDAELAKESRGGAKEEKHGAEAKGEKKQGYGGVEGRGAGVNDRRQKAFFFFFFFLSVSVNMSALPLSPLR